MSGAIDIAWSGPMAHVRIQKRTNNQSFSLGCRDADLALVQARGSGRGCIGPAQRGCIGAWRAVCGVCVGRKLRSDGLVCGSAVVGLAAAAMWVCGSGRSN